MKHCPFCSKTETDYFMSSANFAAIYNISPILPGHSLIIPKKHIESLFHLSNEELAEFMILGRKVANALCGVFETDAFNVAIQEKSAAGQSVAHLHMHIVPRKIGDLVNPGDWYQRLEESQAGDIDTYNKFRLSEEELNTLTNKLKQLI